MLYKLLAAVAVFCIELSVAHAGSREEARGVKHFGLAPPPADALVKLHIATIDPPGSTRTSVDGNSEHAIAGEFDDKNGKTHGFILVNDERFAKPANPSILWGVQRM